MRLQFKIPKFETAHPEKEETTVNIAGCSLSNAMFSVLVAVVFWFKIFNAIESAASKETYSMAVIQVCPSDLQSHGRRMYAPLQRSSVSLGPRGPSFISSS